MISLGQYDRTDINGSNWTVTTFYTTPPMPTYLVALAVCDYDQVNRTERGKEVSRKVGQVRDTELAVHCLSALPPFRDYASHFLSSPPGSVSQASSQSPQLSAAE